MAPFLNVCVGLNGFLIEAVPECQELDHVLGRLFEHYEAINAPSVEPQAVTPIEDKFGEELKHDDDHFVIVVKGIECAFNNWTQVLRIKPVEEALEGLACD